MKAKQVVLITFSTIIFYFFLRITGWTYFSQTKIWQTMIRDNLHHYQLGILLIISALIIKNNQKLQDWLIAIGAGMIIDEIMYVFYPINPQIFNHYHPVGIIIGFITFGVYALIVIRIKKNKTVES